MNGFQAEFDGDELVITCDENWGCCQREQAEQKVRGMNAVREAKGGTTVPKGDLSTEMRADPLYGGQNSIEALKKRHTGTENGRQHAQGTADFAEARGAADCLVEELRNPKKTTQNPQGLPPKTQNDHTLDTKLCGKWDAELVPLDADVNNAFGSVALNCPRKPIRNIVLVCPKGGKCKTESHGVGRPSTPKAQRTKIVQGGPPPGGTTVSHGTIGGLSY